MARNPQEIETEFHRLKTLLNSLPDSKKEVAAEIKSNMRNLQQEMKEVQEAALNKPVKKRKDRKSSSIFANMIALLIILFLGVFALTYFGGKIAAM